MGLGCLCLHCCLPELREVNDVIGYIKQLVAGCFSESGDEVKRRERPDVQTEAERAFVGAGAPATTLN